MMFDDKNMENAVSNLPLFLRLLFLSVESRDRRPCRSELSWAAASSADFFIGLALQIVTAGKINCLLELILT